MQTKPLFRKNLATGIVVLLFCITVVPSSNADSSFNRIPFRNNVVPTSSENRSYWNFTLPTVHINYELNKWKWGVVKFDDFEPLFDVNFSHFENNLILIGFNETVQCLTQEQLLPAFYIATLELFWNGSNIVGFSVRHSSLSKLNWTTQEHIEYFSLLKGMYNNTDIQGRITITGIPLRLHLLYGRFLLDIWWFMSENLLLPFEERHGTTAKFTLHVHN